MSPPAFIAAWHSSAQIAALELQPEWLQSSGRACSSRPAPPDPPTMMEPSGGGRGAGLGECKTLKYYKYPNPFWGPVGWPSHFFGLGSQKPHWTPGWTRPGCESSGVFWTLYSCPWRGPLEPWLLPATLEGVEFGESRPTIQSHSRFLRGAPRCLDSLTQKHFLQRLGTCSCARYINAHMLVSTSVWRS